MKFLVGFSVLAVSLATVGCSQTNAPDQIYPGANAAAEPGLAVSNIAAGADLATATFAGGCFWCMEQPFDKLPGVVSTTSGYTGGTLENPTYSEVSNGGTGHIEAMQVRYDPEQVSYETLLETFWYNIDPLDNAGQFCDKGSQYRSAIFYENAEQQAIAEAA
ncbi:MAG: peptide-methionine (S)-S-oxide reductase MsrA, partial [Phormidesmis sp.]